MTKILVTRHRNFQVRWKINVWASIMSTNILGPVILLNILDHVAYKNFLTENFPDFLKEVPLAERNRIIFQQNSVELHNARVVINYLNEQFPGRWMGRYSLTSCPLRSPDLNPLTFSYGDIAKKLFTESFPRISMI